MDVVATFWTKTFLNNLILSRGGFRGGGGGGGDAPPQGFDPLPTQRVPPLVLFKKSIFCATDPKNRDFLVL